jgi:thiol-disulfide isomerase/thioredoxin
MASRRGILGKVQTLRRCASAIVALIWLASVTGGAGRAEPSEGIPSFNGATAWFNSPPLTPAQLRGKVVLVDFWEYTCINCLRTLPYLREWYRRYHNSGFVIVGVHAPEFNFSAERSNVATAILRLGIPWPVALDGGMEIWNRYHNVAWPGEYLFDTNGKLIDRHFGEGNYPETEAKIQALLKAAGLKREFPAVMALLPQDSYDKPGAVCYVQTPEILVGPYRSRAIANMPAFGDTAADSDFLDPGRHVDGKVYLQGYWRFSPEGKGQGIVSAGGAGYLALRYHAIQVVAVMKPESGSQRVVVTEDGNPVAREDAGSDIRYDAGGASFVEVNAPRAYDLITNRHFGAHELRLTPGGPGVGVYDFAFESCEAGTDK